MNPSDPASQGLKAQTTLSIPHSSIKLSFPSRSSTPIYLRYQIIPNAFIDYPSDRSLPSWDCVLWNDRLYVATAAEHRAAAEGLFFAKEAFMAMLNHAKEELGCKQFVLCLDGGMEKLADEKARVKKAMDLKAVVRLFLFLGFEPLAAGHEFLPSNDKDLVCFVDSI